MLTKFIRRPKEESPIYQRMIADAKTDEDLEKARKYGEKVDKFHQDGFVSITIFPYEGPDLGDKRRNGMAGIPARVYQRMFDSEGDQIDGRRVVPLTPLDSEA